MDLSRAAEWSYYASKSIVLDRSFGLCEYQGNQTYRGSLVFFFFQAEDGIRDWSVTGVQTCALPISRTKLSQAYQSD